MNEQEPELKLPPSATEAEQAVLGAIMVKPDILPRLLDIIETHHFYHKAHQIIFQTMLALWDKGIPSDLVLVTNKLRTQRKLTIVGGAQYLTDLVLNCPSVSRTESYAKEVRAKHLLRAVITSSDKMNERAYELEEAGELIAETAARIDELAQEAARGGRQSALRTVMGDVMTELERRFETGVAPGVPTGFASLDAIFTGWKPGDLDIIAAATSMGKTSFALSCVLNSVLQTPTYEKQFRWAVFSLEMTREQLGEKITSTLSGVSLERMGRGEFHEVDWKSLQRAEEIAYELPLDIFDAKDNCYTPAQMEAKVRRLEAEGKKPDAVLIDLLQKVRANVPHEQRTVEVARIIDSLKNAALRTGIPWVLIAHISREPSKRGDKRPSLNDLKESGAIENDADRVVFLYREDYYNPDSTNPDVVEVRVAKNRSGAVGRTFLNWVKETNTWSDLGPHHSPNTENGAGPGTQNGKGKYSQKHEGHPYRDD